MATVQTSRPPQGSPSTEDPSGDGKRVRITFRQPVSSAGFIDAAWWPRTRDLAVELPPLMDVLWSADRKMNRITYDMRVWDAAPRRMRIEGSVVHLGGFTFGDPNIVTLSDAWRLDRIDVLVVAPDVDPDTAGRIFDIAGRTDSPLRAQEILDRARSGDE